MTINTQIRIILLPYLLFLSGCASTTLTISSQPPGAYLSEIGGTLSGTSPLKIQYDQTILQSTKNSDGCFVAKGWQATWISGATTEHETITLCGSIKNNWTFDIIRPTDYPNLSQDITPDIYDSPTEANNELNIAEMAALAILGGLSQSNTAPPPAVWLEDKIGICNCKGYDGPGGPCYSGPSGLAYDGPGGPAYTGPGGACYAGPNGPAYSGPGGAAYSGPGGPAYNGPGGSAYSGPGGPAYDGPGGPCYEGPGGPCYSGPGGDGSRCANVCRF